ncbi:ribonucleases P/MRP protein subunit POP1 [Silurus asotus]|uniref:Ribonucleases P/MRP protein subunit POP1 n=1 Tax=Silurus asotus TaxID=30991 RepID=A0AAD5FKU8_SILAS|nr:ribonucleases P/MRP protein subunit POP1 [Silurus asotus]
MRHKKMRNQPSNVTYSQSHDGTGRSSDSQEQQQHMKGSLQHTSTRVTGHQDERAVPEQPLPKYITASLFAKARAAEVNAMLRAATKMTSSSHVFGALPKHMRRRAMSHNIKRLPCRLRETAQRMLEKSQQTGKKEKKEQSKTKSRRARRRHGSLLLEFNRRQRKNKWLETHIWHAKRFHMLKKWGYCLGDRPTYKCYRASYRAMNSGCLLQDLSYYCCIELHGPEEHLLTALSRLTNKDAGPTFAAASCVSGQKEGSVMLYKANQYPYQPLGPVQFLWRPCSTASPHRQLWIWAHPTLKQDLLQELQSVCHCFEAVAPANVDVDPSEDLQEESLIPAASSDSKPRCAKRKLKADHKYGCTAKKIVGDGTRSLTTPVSWTSCKTEIVISDLTMEIVRYRLIGPLSHSVLTQMLVPATDCENNIETASSHFWWPEECKKEESMSLHRQQTDIFQLLKGINSTVELPGGGVLGMTVNDPRLSLSAKRGKVTADFYQTQGVDEEQRRNLTLRGVPSFCAQSSLWDKSVRENVTNNKISEKDLNRMKRELLVPGSRLTTPAQGRVPILLVNQAGKQLGEERLGWGSGWDLLLPKGWGMAFWVPLVYSGVRVGGLQMSLKHSQNKGTPHFPHNYPDCLAGVHFQEQQELELLEKFKRHPPSKRTNYIKYGVVAPFRCPWQQLVEEWEERVEQQKGNQDTSEITMDDVTSLSGTSTFTVLRSRKVLRQLSVWCRPSSSHTRRAPRGSCAPSLCPVVSMSLQAQWKRCVLWVRVRALSKGQPALHAMLCVPTTEDLQHFREDPHWSGPMEPQHIDHLKQQLKKRGKSGEASLSCTGLRQDKDCSISTKDDPSSASNMEKNTVVSNNKCSNPSDVLKDSCSESIVCVATDPGHSSVDSLSATGCSNSNLVHGLWTEQPTNVSSHCSRMTLGWVVQGDFSLAAGTGEALGFVSLAGLLQILLGQSADQRGILLLRNPTSLQYRFVRLHIEA